jgi:hypothetical protein
VGTCTSSTRLLHDELLVHRPANTIVFFFKSLELHPGFPIGKLPYGVDAELQTCHWDLRDIVDFFAVVYKTISNHERNKF